MLSQSSGRRSYDLQRGAVVNHVQTALLLLSIAQTVPEVIINLTQNSDL